MSRRASAAPQSIFDHPNDAPLVHVAHAKPEPADTESMRGARDYLANKGRRIKLAVGDKWTTMKNAVKEDNLRKIAELVEKKNFNLPERHSSKGEELTALDYAKKKGASARIIEYLEQRTRMAKDTY